MKEERKAGAKSHRQPVRIIIQLIELCRAELTWTRADFLLLTLPSATSPCRGYMHALLLTFTGQMHTKTNKKKL